MYQYASITLCYKLLDLDELDVKLESRVGGDSGNLLVSISKLGGDGEATLSTNVHANETLVPAGDNLTAAKDEREGLAASVGVELLSVLQLANVTHAEALAWLCGGSGSDLDVLDDKTGGEGALVLVRVTDDTETGQERTEAPAKARLHLS